MSRKKSSTSIPVSTIKHKEKRTNIPTEELRGFVEEDEKHPKTILYPRDTSLDPQLVWKGKDEQDAQDLAVPAVPIYIQEKIHPQAIIENVRAEQKKEIEKNYFLFADDFNGIKFDQLIEFYEHEQNWANRMILGDSLMVMTSLAEKEGLKGKVQMIYIDPPYGINFGSNWQVSTRKRDVKDGKVEDTTRQPEQIRAFRDTWKLGIHSYLAYLRDRLVVARELLTETGSVFVQIGDENVHFVRCLLDEIFGKENLVCEISVQKAPYATSNTLAPVVDYLCWYAKDREKVKYRALFRPKADIASIDLYRLVLSQDGKTYRPITKKEFESGAVPSDMSQYRLVSLISQGAASKSQPFMFNGKAYAPPNDSHWKVTIDGLKKVAAAYRIQETKNSIQFRSFIDDFPISVLNNLWTDTITGSFMEDKIYVVQTNPKIIERCLLMTTDPGDLVLDPTCGSGTTAYVAEQWGRRWITCDTSRVALALARTRFMSAKYPYYLLADSPEGLRKEAEITGKVPPDVKTEGDICKGFVYKRVPHVTLKSIANNPDIKEGMTRQEIDATIASHADTETLYDQPYEDNKRVRVTGSFTVESLSPHRFLSADIDGDGTISEQEARKHHDFAAIILENLRKAGVQNTIKDERLKFDRLEPHAGLYVHASGEYTDKHGKARRVAVCIGPEHGTVGPDLVKEAAKEAVKGVGFDLLIVCGFAFDPHVNEETKQYGKLTVLTARMNPDMAMGDDLLKKTGAGNLFMVFGEPDVEIKKQKDGKLIAKIKGIDVYDPTTGQIRSHTTDDIACWFIDTDYNGESFFVRHAYFTGADEPYDKLKRALRAEVDEANWQLLYSTVSMPFEKPKSGKIAVKVINHYGDEVLKVFEVTK